MLRYALIVLACLLLSACTSGAQGDPGPAGPPGAQGPQGKHGINGEDGTDAAQDGSRLTARWIVGEDNSRQFNGDFLDTVYDEPCTYQDNGDELRCMPAFQDSTGLQTFEDATCSGQWAGPLYKGSHFLRYLVDDTRFRTAEEVPQVYVQPPGSACVLYAQPGPYYLWIPIQDTDFVLGIVEP